MVKSGNSRDGERHRVVPEELAEFKKLVRGHERLLRAIGEL